MGARACVCVYVYVWCKLVSCMQTGKTTSTTTNRTAPVHEKVEWSRCHKAPHFSSSGTNPMLGTQCSRCSQFQACSKPASTPRSKIVATSLQEAQSRWHPARSYFLSAYPRLRGRHSRRRRRSSAAGLQTSRRRALASCTRLSPHLRVSTRLGPSMK
jgi:hypothetical protein